MNLTNKHETNEITTNSPTEKWANDALHSLTNAKKATPNNAVFERILENLPQQIIHKNNSLAQSMSFWQLSWSAVAACFVIMLNLYVLLPHTNQTEPQPNTWQTQYHSLISDYSLY